MCPAHFRSALARPGKLVPIIIGATIGVAALATLPPFARAEQARSDAGVVVQGGKGAVTLRLQPVARVNIPAGRFTMGASRSDVQQARAMCAEELRMEGALKLDVGGRCSGRFEGEAPQAAVFVPAFSIDRQEVTVSEFAACLRAGDCGVSGQAGVTGLSVGRLPMERVSHAEAESFCRWRGGRLPTEVEWEKAARGLGTWSWPWGAVWLDARANHGRAADPATGPAPGSRGRDGDRPLVEVTDADDGFEGRAEVGSFARGASPFGVEDMAGNVWEWTSTFFTREPPQTATRYDPRGPVFASERTVRGGGYRSPPSDLRVTRRVGLHPEERVAGVGFRCAYDVKPRR